MAHWNSKVDRSNKKRKREARMNNQQVTQAQVPGAVGVVTKTLENNAVVPKYAGVSYGYGHYQARPLVPTPTDTKDTSKLSIVLMRQSVLNAISAICQPVAGASEFQVHYRALIMRIKNTQNELIINIPTVFYNFKQTVAGASVDYHLDDIDNEAEAVRPISDKIVKDIFKDMPILLALKEMYGDSAEVTFSEVNSGSIHRHPGRFGFSATDYTKTPSNPGVIYREAQATDKVHTDSVIYLGARTEIYTTETRILNIAPKDNGVEGTYCQLPTTTFLLNDLVPTDSAVVVNTMADFLGGIEETMRDSSGDYYITNAMGAVTGYAVVTEVINAFKDASFEQDISHVLASHITGRYSAYTYGQGNLIGTAGKKQEKASKNLYNYWGDGFDDYDYLEDATYYSEKYGTQPTQHSKGGHWLNGAYIPPVKEGPKKVQPTTTSAVKVYDKLKNPYPVGSLYHDEWNQRFKV